MEILECDQRMEYSFYTFRGGGDVGTTKFKTMAIRMAIVRSGGDKALGMKKS